MMAVPSSALALQVGAMFMYAPGSSQQGANTVWIVSEQLEIIDHGIRPSIIVGTPEALETLLVTGFKDHKESPIKIEVSKPTLPCS